MKFEEIDLRLDSALTIDKMEGYSPLQQQVLSLMKQGKHQLVLTSHTAELDRILQLISFMKGPEMLEGSPRVLWATPTITRALDMASQAKSLFRRSDVTIETAVDKGKMIEQRNLIFDGCEILIGNPNRLLDLYIQNGFHINQLTLFIIDQADIIARDAKMSLALRRISESLPKCQRMIFSENVTPKLEEFVADVCTFSNFTEL